MTASRGTTDKLALLVLAASLAVACSSDKRTLLLVNVSLQSGVPAPDSVFLEVTAAGSSFGTAQFPWSQAKNGILQAGVFLPDGVPGSVTVTAIGQTAVGATVGVASQSDVAIQTGTTNGPISLQLAAGGGPPDGGLPDGGPASDTASADLADSAPVTLDGGASEGRAGDGNVLDGGVAESAPPDGNDGGTDVPATDTNKSDSAPPTDADGGADVPATNSDGNNLESGVSPTDGPVLDAPATGDSGSTVEAGSETSQSPAWQPATNIENDILSRSYEPEIAVEPIAENVYVIWIESTAVKLRRWDRQAGTWGPVRTLQSGGDPYSAWVGTDAAGHIIAAWYQDSQVADTSLPGIWVSQSSDGTSWSPPVKIVSGTIVDLQLGVARNGVARMAFSRQTGTDQVGLFTAYYDASSWSVSTDPVLAPDSPHTSQYGYSSSPQLAISGTGDGVVVFEEYDDAGNTSVGVVNLTGTTRSAPQILDTDTTNDIYYTSRWAAMNANGEGAVVWTQNSDTSLYLSIYKPAVGWSTPQKLADSDDFDDTVVTIDDKDFITAAWVQSIAISGYNVMAMHGKVGGTWSDITPLETDNKASWQDTSEFAYPKLAADAAGNVLAVWKKKVNDTTFGAYARRLQGDTWQPQVQLGQKTGLTAYQPVVAAADSGFGAATFTFVDPTGETTDPEAYNVEVALCR